MTNEASTIPKGEAKDLFFTFYINMTQGRDRDLYFTLYIQMNMTTEAST